MIQMLFGWMLLIPFTILAFWHQDMILWIAAGIMAILFSLTYIDDLGGIGIALCGLGVYELVQAVSVVLISGGSAKGWSQFQGLYHKIRGK